MRLLHRYILLELLGPFVFSVGIFVALFLGANVLYDLTRWSAKYQVSPFFAARLVAYRLPWILSLTFPMSMLLGSLLCFGRLSGDHEISAMLAGGASFMRLAAPVLVAGVVVSGGTWFLSETLCPAGKRAEANLMASVREGSAGAGRDVALVERKPGDIQLGIFAEEFHLGRRELKNVTVVVSQHWQPRILVSAARAVWQGEKWHLYEGRILLGLEQEGGSDPPGSASEFDVTLGPQRVTLDRTPAEIARETASTSELTAAELRQRILDKQARGPEWHREVVSDLVALHSKYALPCTCFLFALIGTPLGVRPQRSSRGVAYGICLATIFAHYVLWHTFKLLGESDYLPPAIAVWTPNLILGLVGVVFLLRAAR